MSANVIRGGNDHARLLFDGNSGTISSGAITGALEFCGPGAQVSMIRRRQTAAFFYIKKHDRSGGKALALCYRGRVSRVGVSLLHRTGFVLEFATQRPPIKKQKAKSLRSQNVALAEPGVCFFTGRRTKPVATEGKRISQNRKSRLARENVEIKTEISARRLVLLWIGPCTRSAGKQD